MQPSNPSCPRCGQPLSGIPRQVQGRLAAGMTLLITGALWRFGLQPLLAAWPLPLQMSTAAILIGGLTIIVMRTVQRRRCAQCPVS